MILIFVIIDSSPVYSSCWRRPLQALSAFTSDIPSPRPRFVGEPDACLEGPLYHPAVLRLPRPRVRHRHRPADRFRRRLQVAVVRRSARGHRRHVGAVRTLSEAVEPNHEPDSRPLVRPQLSGERRTGDPLLTPFGSRSVRALRPAAPRRLSKDTTVFAPHPRSATTMVHWPWRTVPRRAPSPPALPSATSRLPRRRRSCPADCLALTRPDPPRQPQREQRPLDDDLR